MLSCDHALAILLLTTALDPADLGPHLALVKPTFLALAVEAEILDRREEQFFEGLSQDPLGDVRALQQRYRQLQKAPRLAECERFLDRNRIEHLLAFNRAYRKDLLAGLELEARYAEQFRQAINEVDQCYLVWSLLRDARCGFYYVTARRQALLQLRDLVGVDAYYSAELPPHVPSWHFPRMK